jgi:ribosomal protein S18 acetylase RimI-like enzyme
VEIRFLTSADAREWSRLRLQALQGDPEAFSSSVEEHQTLTPEDIARRLGSETGDSFVAGAFDGALLVGVAGFFRERGPKLRHKGTIWGVFVDPAWRAQGIGRSLLRAVLDRGTRIQGIEQVLLSVSTTRPVAAKLYRSFGFMRFGVEPRALKIDGRFIDEEYMVLTVNPANAT